MKNTIIKSLIFLLLFSGSIGLIYSITKILETKENLTLENTTQNYQLFKSAELADKCQTPTGYSEAEWQEHMSHHPDQYQECF